MTAQNVERTFAICLGPIFGWILSVLIENDLLPEPRTPPPLPTPPPSAITLSQSRSLSPSNSPSFTSPSASACVSPPPPLPRDVDVILFDDDAERERKEEKESENPTTAWTSVQGTHSVPSVPMIGRVNSLLPNMARQPSPSRSPRVADGSGGTVDETGGMEPLTVGVLQNLYVCLCVRSTFFVNYTFFSLFNYIMSHSWVYRNVG